MQTQSLMEDNNYQQILDQKHILENINMNIHVRAWPISSLCGLIISTLLKMDTWILIVCTIYGKIKFNVDFNTKYESLIRYSYRKKHTNKTTFEQQKTPHNVQFDVMFLVGTSFRKMGTKK